VCYAVGQDDIPQKVGTAWDAGSAVIAITRDGGQIWQPVRFAVPAKVPSRMEATFDDIGEIQCPQADTCVAMGVYEQGSMSSVPIYTLHG
jgi:anti-sigma factor RsiW